MSCTSVKTRGRCTGRPAGAMQSDGLSQERSEQSPAMEGTLIQGTPHAIDVPAANRDQATGMGTACRILCRSLNNEVSEDHDRQSCRKPKKLRAPAERVARCDRRSDRSRPACRQARSRSRLSIERWRVSGSARRAVSRGDVNTGCS